MKEVPSNVFERLLIDEDGLRLADLRKAPQDDVIVERIKLDPGAAAARLVGRDEARPRASKGDEATPFLCERSRLASATSATGLTVGCMASSLSPVEPKALTPA